MNARKEAAEQSEDSIDLSKLKYLLYKSRWIILVFFFTGIFSAYLVVRYTKPLYQSSSVIKLSFESEASNLGLVSNSGFQNELNEISGEIELLKSNLFLKRVADVINYPVSYYFYGTYLVDERYRNNPFVVSYKVKNPSYYDQKFDIEILDKHSFLLDPGGNYDFEEPLRFGQEIITDDFNLLIEKTSHFDKSIFGKYYFIIHSEQGLLNYFKNNLQIQPENFNAKTIRISLADYNRNKAQDFVMAIDTLYLKYTTESKNKALEQKILFLDRQIKATEKRLQEFEAYFENFTIENKTVSLQSDLSKTITLLNSLDSQRFYTKEQYNNIKIIQDQVEEGNALSANPYLIRQLPQFISEALTEYEELVEERNRKINLYNENTYVIREVDRELSRAKTYLNELVTEHAKNLNEKLSELSRRISILESNFVQLPGMGTEYNKNKRLYSLQENFLLSLRQSKMDLEITRAGTVTESVILSSASMPSAPIKPQKLLIFGIGFISAVILSVLFVLIRYLLHNKVSSTREVERLTSIPVIGSIPLHTNGSRDVSRLIVEFGSKTAISEALRTIRTNMEFFNPLDNTEVISVTSTVSGEGKTFIAVNLGAIIASTKSTVCVVDMDMRKPKVHLAFGDENNTEGVSTLLIGKSTLKDCIRSSENENLFYISAGPIPPNPSELILGDEFDKILKALKKKFDLVILDTPPVGIVTDGILAMKRSDIQFYVLKSDYSRREYLRNLENIQRINDFHNLAIVVNGVAAGRSDYSYYDKRGYGYYTDKDSPKFKLTGKS